MITKIISTKQFCGLIKNMKKQITISYNWSNDNGVEIPAKHQEALEEDAQERIFEQIQKRNTSGELHSSVKFGKDIVPEENEEDGIEYSGWWSLTTKTL